MLIATEILRMMITFYRLVVIIIHRVSRLVNLVFIFFALINFFFLFNFDWIFIILNKKIVFFIKWTNVNCVAIVIIVFKKKIYAWLRFLN